LLFYGIEFKGTEIYTPISQEGSVYVEDILDKRYCCGCFAFGRCTSLCCNCAEEKRSIPEGRRKISRFGRGRSGMIVAADAGAESVERNHGKVYIEFPKLGGFTRCMGNKRKFGRCFS